MASIQIEAQISTEQLLDAVEQLPPGEFVAFLGRLLDRVRGVGWVGYAPSAHDSGPVAPDGSIEQHPYLAAAGMFAHDSFAAEVEAYIAAQRQREREDAALEADA